MLSLRVLALLSIVFVISSSLPIINNEITEGSGEVEGSGAEDTTIPALLDSEPLEGSGIEGIEGSGARQADNIEGSGESVAAIITRLLAEGSGESA